MINTEYGFNDILADQRLEGSEVLDSFGFYTFGALADIDKQPPEFIVDGMIPIGLTFLSGAPKLRKSFMALQLAEAVATGGEFLGHTCKQCDVAYLDLEGSKSRFAARAKRMTAHNDKYDEHYQFPGNIRITNQCNEKIADGSLIKKIRKLHQEYKQTRLIIIDTYSRARGSVKSSGANAYDSDVALLEPVQRMAQDEKIAIVMIHHDRKGANFSADSFERLSGTMGISGSADAVLTLIADGKRFDGKATLEYTPRDARGGEMRLIFDESCCLWQEDKTTINADMMHDNVIQWIIQNAPNNKSAGKFVTYSEAWKGITGFVSDDAHTLIKRSIDNFQNELFVQERIAVQVGVKSSGDRGIRIIKL